MMNKNLRNKHIEEVAAYLAQHMEFSADEIARALYKFAMAIEDMRLDHIKIYGDVVIFGGVDTEYEGVNIRKQQYLNDYDCYNIINPYFLLI